ncbi:MAG: hypothetical protein ACHQVS_03710 [Candidatus Babeliales bacterium]
MNEGMRLGYVLLVCSSLVGYAADKKGPGSERSLSSLVAEVGAVSLQPVHIQSRDMLPHSDSGTSSLLFPRSKSNGSKSSGSRRSSADERDTDTEEGTERSYAILGSPLSSRQNSPKNSARQKSLEDSVHQKILAQEPNLRKSMARVVACLPGLDTHQREEVGNQLIRNVIVQLGIYIDSRVENKRVEPILDDQLDKELAADIAAHAQANKKGCCGCVIL